MQPVIGKGIITKFTKVRRSLSIIVAMMLLVSSCVFGAFAETEKVENFGYNPVEVETYRVPVLLNRNSLSTLQASLCRAKM